MNNVNILDKYWLCKDYALKRTGISNLNECNELYGGTQLKKGDILMWKQDSDYYMLPVSISSNCILTYKNVTENAHYAVYEGNNLVSDLSYTNSRPIIRIRELNDLNAPDKIYRIEKEI